MAKSSLEWVEGTVLNRHDQPEPAAGAECPCGSQEFVFYKAKGCPNYHLQCTICNSTYCMGTEDFGPSLTEGSSE